MTEAGNPECECGGSAAKLELLRWHIDRYDRLRLSTATRAGVVLSASALISAANAVILSEVLRVPSGGVMPLALSFCVLATLASASFVVLAVVRASSVLVTLKDSRTLFAKDDDLPAGPLFNGTDTVARVHSFAEFSSLIAEQRETDHLQGAAVELWIGIQQHRHRYLYLRSAVRQLRYASLTLLIALVAMVLVEILSRTG